MKNKITKEIFNDSVYRITSDGKYMRVYMKCTDAQGSISEMSSMNFSFLDHEYDLLLHLCNKNK